MTLTEQAQALFTSDRYATEQSSIAIVSVASHDAVCRMPLCSTHCNARGMAMGGALYTLADFTAAVAANSDCIESGDLRWVSLDANIHYLRPARQGDTLTAHSHPLHMGRSTALFHTDITSLDSGKCIAVVETTMVSVGS